MNQIVLKGYIAVPDSDLAAVKKELPIHIELSRKEEGCLMFEVTQDDQEKNKFHVFETFMSESAFSKHQQRVKKSKWGAITQNVERFYKVTGLSE